jgi:hypothetical protein
MRDMPLALLLLCATACRVPHPATVTAEHRSVAAHDSSFAAMQARGAMAMGVDQYTSTHVFEPLPDGGRIVLERDMPDSEGTIQIRAHMHAIATAFAAGDFQAPGLVHAQAVPGTDVMAAKRAVIAYTVDTLPRGAAVRLQTADPAAVQAIHEFLAFQRQEHHAAAHHQH